MAELESEQELEHDKEKLARALPRLTPEQLAQVSPHLVHESYQAGETIIQQGEAPDRFYILISGRVEIWHEDLEGEHHLVTESGPGDFFGETGLLHNQPRTATVRVSSESAAEVLSLDRTHFQEMINESRATETQVAREMIERLIKLSDFQS